MRDQERGNEEIVPPQKMRAIEPSSSSPLSINETGSFSMSSSVSIRPVKRALPSKNSPSLRNAAIVAKTVKTGTLPESEVSESVVAVPSFRLPVYLIARHAPSSLRASASNSFSSSAAPTSSVNDSSSSSDSLSRGYSGSSIQQAKLALSLARLSQFERNELARVRMQYATCQENLDLPFHHHAAVASFLPNVQRLSKADVKSHELNSLMTFSSRRYLSQAISDVRERVEQMRAQVMFSNQTIPSS